MKSLSGSLMLDVAGVSLTNDEKERLAQPEVAGLILFSRNYQDRSQLSALIAEIRACQPDILIAVDQEGGRVQRFKEGFERLPSLQKIVRLAEAMPEDADDILRTMGWLMAADVLSAGIDISFAPVLDLDVNQCAVISDRSFSDDPDRCVYFAKAYIDGMHEAGMQATAKHFPGHGAVREDSHLELPVDYRELVEVETRDLRPFSELSRHYDAVMPGHLLFPKVDDNPVGFSPFWLQEILRGKLGFKGVIFSDDLSMEGAAECGSYSRRAELALTAGCDMVLACNNPEGAMEVLEWLRAQSIVGNERPARMRSRVQWDLNTMHAAPRYQRAQKYIDKISKLF